MFDTRQKILRLAAVDGDTNDEQYHKLRKLLMSFGVDGK